MNRCCGKLLLFVLLTQVLAACTYDDAMEYCGTDSEVSDDRVPAKSNYYLAVNVVLSDAAVNSRATTWDDDGGSAANGDYVYGTDIENGIGLSGHFILFFRNNLLYNIYPLTLPNRIDMTPGEGEGDKIELTYWTLIRDIDKDSLPDKALVILNSQSIYDSLVAQYQLGVATETNVLDFIWRESVNPSLMGRNGDNLFVMTNSTYIKDGGVYCAVPVTEEMYHELIDVNDPLPGDYDFKALPEEEVLRIRVERMLAKVTFEMTGGVTEEAGYIYTPVEKQPDDEDYFDYNHLVNLCLKWNHIEKSTSYNDGNNEYTVVTEDWEPVVEQRDWKAEITGWDMNALEPETYLYKKVKATGYGAFFPAWSDPSYYRTFWAEDPGYSRTDYPWQYRRAINQDLTYYESKYNGGGTANTNWLLNYSYNELNKSDFNEVRYFPENTYDCDVLDASSLDNRRDLLAGTHLIICAKLRIADGEGEWMVKDVYRDNRGIFYLTSRDCLWSLVRMFNYTLESQERMRYTRFNWKASGPGEILYGVPYEGKSDYQLYYDGRPLTFDRIMKDMSPDECTQLLAMAEIKKGDGKRVLLSDKLTIENSSGQKLPIYSQYILGADSETHQRYDNSRYYLREADNDDVLSLILEWSGAVDHFNSGLMYYPAPARIEEGVYGMVRNGWYRYRLTAINSIGIPVDIPDQPIVPNWDTLYDGVNLSVELLDWHEVDLGGPDILPK